MGLFSVSNNQTPRQKRVKQQRLNKVAKAHNQSLFSMARAFPAPKPPKKK